MSKRSKRGLSKKGLHGLTKQRDVIFDKEGKATNKSKLARDKNNNIIWLYKGRKHSTLREVVTQNYLDLLGLQI